jgi:hypothetical protein
MIEEYSYRLVARFGLMHMISTNLCEWLYVVVEETKLDILQVLNTTNTKYYSGEYLPIASVPGHRLSGIESRWGRDFSHTSRPAMGPNQPPVQWVSGLSQG